ncbi:MAG: O-antigen ligase family protein [Candidatus Theseobacter exili]|nr:O-antigen ligase family protein [Candidatus Theseobacter exili]
MLLSLTFILAIHSIIQFHTGSGFGGLEPIFTRLGETMVTRVVAYGIFNDSNDLALAFVIMVPFILMTITSAKSLVEKIVVAGISCPIFYALWLTNSRGGLLALLVTVVVYFRNRIKGAKWIFVTLIIAAVIVPVLPSRFTQTLFGESSLGRVISWGYGNQMFKANPVFGVGFKMFTEFADWRSAHNSFVNTYAELGFFGYFFWLGLIFVSLLGLYKAIFDKEYVNTTNRRLVRYGEAIFASLVGFLACGFFLTRSFNVVFFMLIAITVRTRLLVSANKVFVGDVMPGYLTKRLFLMCVGSILFMYVLTRLLLKMY